MMSEHTPLQITKGGSETSQGGLGDRDRLKVCSVLLAYPDGSEFMELVSEVILAAEDARDEQVRLAAHALEVVPQTELVRSYVSTFDLKESMALYLTAHELGDSRERGGALLSLHAMLRSAALEPLEGELPDYLPLLFEFLAEKPLGMPTEELEQRLSVVVRGITERLSEENPYAPLFQLAAMCLPKVVVSDEGEDRLREQADVDNLPYPLVYD